MHSERFYGTRTSHSERFYGTRTWLPRRVFQPKPFNINTYEKCVCNSFNINTYKNKGLKVLYHRHLQKKGWGLRSLFTSLPRGTRGHGSRGPRVSRFEFRISVTHESQLTNHAFYALQSPGPLPCGRTHILGVEVTE